MATADLFSDGPAEQLPLAGADVVLHRAVDLPDLPENILADLLAHTRWCQEQVTVWGKQHMQPRLSCWQGDAGQAYRYSGATLVAEPRRPRA